MTSLTAMTCTPGKLMHAAYPRHGWAVHVHGNAEQGQTALCSHGHNEHAQLLQILAVCIHLHGNTCMATHA